MLLPQRPALLRVFIVLERDTPAELFERILHCFRAHQAEAGDSLPVSLLLECFHGEGAPLELDETLRYGLTHRLIVRVSWLGYRVALTSEGAKRARPRTMKSGSGE
jgi:hypothetical protein